MKKRQKLHEIGITQFGIKNTDSLITSNGVDPPCMRLIDTRARYGKLSFMIYFRSWDLWAGFPSNLAGLQLLKEHMAGEIGVADGEIIAAGKGMHLYEYCWDLAKLRVNPVRKTADNDETDYPGSYGNISEFSNGVNKGT